METDEPFAMGQDVCLIRSDDQNQRYLNYFLRSAVMGQQLAILLVGSTFDRINVAEIKNLVINVPPRAEQDAIAEYLDAAVARIARGLRTSQRQIEFLHEYRTSLIADVMTGKLDVREAAARLPEDGDEVEPLDEPEELAEEGDGEDAEITGDEAD